jgi:GntR family carbon starvation induced transcriptional regulator
MPVAQPSCSLTQTTYERLRRDLLACRLSPGERINVKVLAESVEANVSAVREALSRLAAEELVIAEPQKGFRVAPISVADLLDLTSVRIEVEGNCLRRSIEAGDVAWEARILAAFHCLSHVVLAAPDGLVSNDWNIAHAAFHESLMSACPSPRSLRLHTVLFEQYSRYRALSLVISVDDRDLVREHRMLMEAALCRDISRVLELLGAHIQQTTDVLVRNLQTQAG